MHDAIFLSNLTIEADGQTLVHDVGLSLVAGQRLALLGPSGTGKSLTAKAMLDLVNCNPGVTTRKMRVVCDGQEWEPHPDHANPKYRNSYLRGNVLVYLPQNGRRSLDPMRTVGWQITAALNLNPSPTSQNVIHWLQRAGLDDPEVAGLYPHQLSGGMARRVTIAQALARGCRFLLLDEPTSGVETQGRIALMSEFSRIADEGIGILLISHDLPTTLDWATDTLLMDQGKIVETLRPDQWRCGDVHSEIGRSFYQALQEMNGGDL